MNAADASRTLVFPQCTPVDDAYTAWFNANRRCARTLHDWKAAAPAARADAYRAYLFELELEEAAARALEQLHAFGAAPPRA